MRKLIFIALLVFLKQFAKSQNHLIGANIGFYTYDPHFALNYQFNYKLLNTKIKSSVLLSEFSNKIHTSINDIYLGIKTNEDKTHIFYINTGVSLYTDITVDESYMKQQVNPIIDFGYALSIKNNHHITFDISFSKLDYFLYDKYGKRSKGYYPVFIAELGYAYKFNKRTKEEKTTN